MSSYVFDQIKPLVSTQGINFVVADNVFYIALVNQSVFDDFTSGSLSSELIWSDISSNEITSDSSLNSDGYEILPLTNVQGTDVTVNGFTQTHITADDIVYPVSTIDAYGAVIFRNDQGSIGAGGKPVYNGTLIVALDFGGRVSSNNGVYTVTLSDGFLRIR